ncbi:MAG: hypothetical protein AAFP19_17370 [Bacteroidota bacterium]
MDHLKHLQNSCIVLNKRQMTQLKGGSSDTSNNETEVIIGTDIEAL